MSDSNHYFCACGFDYYNTPNPSSSVILINNKNQIYLAKRAREPKLGSWVIPGGFINFYESAEDAAKREIKEELGVNLNNLNFFCSYSNDYLYKGTQYYPLDIFFISKVDLDEIEPVEKEELSEGRFFDIDKLLINDFAFNSQKQAIKKYLNIT